MQTRGFTLVEIIVVVTIVSLLSGVGFLNYSVATKRARDDDRKADIITLKTAIELYKTRNGRYPAGCRAAGQWSGQIGTSYACLDGSSQYIVGLAPAFIPTLPQEKKLNGLDSGYVYVTNAAGTVYKFEAKKTVESEVVTSVHKFASCDVNSENHPDGGMCIREYPSNNTPNWCQDYDTTFQTTYGVWGGYANASSDLDVERDTEDIICAIQ